MNSLLTHLINTALALDMQAPRLLKKLEGKSIEVHLKSKLFVKKFFFSINDARLEARDSLEDPASVVIQGPLTAFVDLALNKNVQAAAKLGLSFKGDAATLETLQGLFFSLAIDWEEWVSQWTGDVVAHTLGQWARTFRNRQATLVNRTCQSTTEYLTEEVECFPTRPEVNHFLNAVDQLRADTDRLTLRMERLTHLLKKETL